MPTMVSAPLADDPAGVSDMVTVWRPRGAGSSLLCGGDPRMLAQERGHDVAARTGPNVRFVAPRSRSPPSRHAAAGDVDRRTARRRWPPRMRSLTSGVSAG